MLPGRLTVLPGGTGMNAGFTVDTNAAVKLAARGDVEILCTSILKASLAIDGTASACFGPLEVRLNISRASFSVGKC